MKIRKTPVVDESESENRKRKVEKKGRRSSEAWRHVIRILNVNKQAIVALLFFLLFPYS